MWQDDGFKDYLYPKKEAAPEGRTVLTKLINGDSLTPNQPPPAPKPDILYQMDIEDDDSTQLEELGIQPDKLRTLLAKKPELVQLLQEGLGEIGLDG